MHNPSETTLNAPRPDPEPTLVAIIRGEDVLEEAREVAQRISGRVTQAVTQRPSPGELRPDRQ